MIQTLQRRILLREGAFQSKNFAGNNTFGELHRGTRGIAPSMSKQQQETLGDGVEMDRIF